MRIAIFTNTFLPHVGGVARSVRTFLEDYRRQRHRVLVVAPEFAEGTAPRSIERSVERVPAWQKFNGSDFSVSLPLGSALMERVAAFRPDLVHAQHPFLLGDSALRIGASRGVPVVFTHHTLYEQYTHYVPFDSPALQAFVIELATRFANCCHGVIAPSQSVADLLHQRGVTAPIQIIPTGIDTARFSAANRATWRDRLAMPADGLLIGHVGRLAPEKNLPFLAAATARCLARAPRARLLVVGDGPSRAETEAVFAEQGVGKRVHFAGKLTGQALRDAFAAMDLFVFSSRSETQGMVLAEAMATGCPVVALDASGVREVVRDRVNGRLLPADAPEAAMTRALAQAVRQPATLARWREGARHTAQSFDRRRTAKQALDFYREVIDGYRASDPTGLDEWENKWRQLRDRLAIEGRLLTDKVVAATHALVGSTGNSEPAAASA